MLIPNCAKCEMQSIVRFLNTKEESFSRRNSLIPRIINVYGNVINKRNIAKCYRDFNTERKMKHFFFIMKFRSFRTKKKKNHLAREQILSEVFDEKTKISEPLKFYIFFFIRTCVYNLSLVLRLCFSVICCLHIRNKCS